MNLPCGHAAYNQFIEQTEINSLAHMPSRSLFFVRLGPIEMSLNLQQFSFEKHQRRFRSIGMRVCRFVGVAGIGIASFSANQIGWPSASSVHATEYISSSRIVEPVQDDEIDLNEVEEKVFRAAVNQIAPSVVQIETIGGSDRVGTINLDNAATTGVVVSKDGYLIGSQFAFTRSPSAILVTLPDGSRVPANLVATDHARGLVLLKIETELDLTVPEAVPRSELAAGQWTIAVGRTFSVETPNVSIGVLSATDRIWGRAVQTDAKISPYNYGGPLIDWKGRVIGILTPLSHREGDGIGGTDWYDSGIGFAIPFEDVLARVDRLQQGKDIHPGKLGVTFQGANIYTDSPIVENVLPVSPADSIGLLPGDRITHVNDRSITRMAELRHALGVVDAEQSVKLTWVRDEETFSKSVELAIEIKPYFFRQLGVIPEFFVDESNNEEGIEVHAIQPNSPAENAGIRPNDRIVAINNEPAKVIADALRLVSQANDQGELSLRLIRDGVEQEITIPLEPLQVLDSEQVQSLAPTSIEADLESECEVVSIKLPEEEHDCFAIVPKASVENPNYRLLIWIPPAGQTDRVAMEKEWRSFCNSNQTILFVPDSGDRKTWNRTDVEYLRKSTDELVKQYRFDLTSIACGGLQSGGSLAMLFSVSERDLVRGLVCVDANPVLSLATTETRPNERLLIYAATSDSGKQGSVADFFLQLSKNGHPVTNRNRKEASTELSEEELNDLGNWLKLLNRF